MPDNEGPRHKKRRKSQLRDNNVPQKAASDLWNCDLPSGERIGLFFPGLAAAARDFLGPAGFVVAPHLQTLLAKLPSLSLSILTLHSRTSPYASYFYTPVSRHRTELLILYRQHYAPCSALKKTCK